MATTYDPSFLPEVEKFTRIALALSKPEIASKLMKNKGIDMSKGYSQDEYLEEILDKQILTTELPRGYLTASDELAAKQAAKRSLDNSAPHPPTFKPNKIMEEMNFVGEMKKGSANLQFSDAVSDINWGKTMAFVGKHSLGVAFATMVAGGGIGLVSGVAVTYAISTVTKKAVFAILEQIGVMGAIREALSGLLKKLSNIIKFDKIKEASPTLAKAALCIAAATVLTVALTTGVEAAEITSLGSSLPSDAPTQVSDAFKAALSSTPPSVPVTPEVADAVSKALESVTTGLEAAPDDATQQIAFGESVLKSVGAPDVEVKNLTSALSNNQGFAGLMTNSEAEVFKDFKNVSSVFESPVVEEPEFSLFKDTPELEPDSIEPSKIATPDAATPDAATPDAATPDAATPDAAAPDAATPDAATPDVEAPEAAPEAAQATPEFAVESLKTIELPVEHSVWRTYENYIESQGIEFASEAEANDAYVHYMQEIARLNPEIESIHNVGAGDMLKFPEISNLQTAQAAVDDIEFTVKDNVLSSHTPTEGMIAAEKARLAEAAPPAPDNSAPESATTAPVNESNKAAPTVNAPTQDAAVDSELTKGIQFSAMSTELYEARTGQSVGFVFEDDVNDKAEVFAEHLVSKIDQSNYSQIEKDFAIQTLAESIVSQTSVAMSNEGVLNAPATFTELDMARFASSVDDKYVGEWVLEHGKTYTEANFYMDNQGVVRNAKSIEQVAASIAQELHDRGDVDMTHQEVAQAYKNILESIKVENGVTGNEVEVDKIKIPEAMQSDLKNERILQVREPHQTRHSSMRR